MNKKMLYAASAAVALLSAGNAYAIEVAGLGSYTGVNSTTGSVAVKLASELNFTASASTASAFERSAGSASYRISASTGNSLPTNIELVLHLDLANAIFNAASPASAVLSGTGNCAFTASPLSGIAAGGTSASYLLNMSGCTASSTDGIEVVLPIRATGAGPVAIGSRIATQAGNLDVDGGRRAVTFIQLAPAFSVEIKTGTSAVAEVTASYRALTGAPVTVGSYQLKIDNTVITDIRDSTATTGFTTTASTTDVARIVLTAQAANNIRGFSLYNNTATSANAFTAVTATIDNTRSFTVGTPTTTATNILVADNTYTGTGTATADIISRDDIIGATGLTLSANIDLVSQGTTGTNYFTDKSVSGALSPVTRNGVSFVAPWVALGATAANSSIRLANNGARDTGPIRVTLLSHNGTGAPTSSTVTISSVAVGDLTGDGGIPVGRAVTLSGADLRALFGTNAANGDVEVSVEAPSGTISGKVRNTQSTGQIFEITTGQL